MDPLLNKGIILLKGDVNGAMVGHLYQSLAVLEGQGSPDIEIRIFSGGGSVAAGLDIYDAIRRYAGKKIGVVYAYARSMGAIVLQACDERVCLPHARVLIHHINRQSVSLDDLDDAERLEVLRTEMWENQNAIYAILIHRTNKTKKEISEACKKDRDMTAQEALSFGLIDRIDEKEGG